MRSGQTTVALHHVLLRIAGWAHDEIVSTARDWLAQGRTTEVAQLVSFVALAGRIPVAPADLEALRTALRDDDVNHDHLAELDTAPAVEPSWYAMSPVFAQHPADGPDDVPHSLDLAMDPVDGHYRLDAVDEAAVVAVSRTDLEGRVDGLWRAWRFPVAPTPWPPPRRVYLVQAAEPEPLPALTAHLQRALAVAGESVPQVEAFTDADELPAYQRMALAHSALLWTVRPTNPIRIAGLFDPVDEVGGPGFAEDRPTLGDQESGDVLAYLEAARAVLTTTALMDDVVDDRRRGVVPMTVRTDGEWIWTDAVPYYLRHYGLAPDRQLLKHIRTRRYAVTAADAVAVHRALAALQAPDDER